MQCVFICDESILRAHVVFHAVKNVFTKPTGSGKLVMITGYFVLRERRFFKFSSKHGRLLFKCFNGMKPYTLLHC